MLQSIKECHHESMAPQSTSAMSSQLAYLLNVIGMSCKKIQMLLVAQGEYVIEALNWVKLKVVKV
jgi:hypothetical protein